MTDEQKVYPLLLQFTVIFNVPLNADGVYDVDPLLDEGRLLLQPMNSCSGFVEFGSAGYISLEDEQDAKRCDKCGRWATNWYTSKLDGPFFGQEYSDGFFCSSCRIPPNAQIVKGVKGRIF